MNVFFDNCTSPICAAALDAVISADGHRAVHIRDVPALPNGRDSDDIDWITYLREDALRWIFVTGDDRARKNPATRAALRSAGLHGFVLAPAYQRAPLNQVAATILWKWPEMLKITEILKPPSVHEIPIGRLTKLATLPL